MVKRFGALTILSGMDLGLAQGEFLTLLGPSGCGKTTLLRIIAGFLRQDEGRVLVGGAVIDDAPPHRRGFGMVFQNYAVFPHMTVFDNVAYGLRARGVGRAERERRVTRALERVQLGEYAARFPPQLSGGQKQRVGLARAIVIEPSLLLMDEPLSNLDAKLRIEMRREIRLLQRELGITTLYVTHDQEEALAVSDRIALLERGRLLQVGPPRSIYDDPAHLFVADFIGGANKLKAVTAEGAPVTVTLRPEDLRLEPGPRDIGRIEATALIAAYLGGRARLTCVLPDGAPLEADIPADATPPAPGAPTVLWFDPARARVFDQDGARVRGASGWRVA